MSRHDIVPRDPTHTVTVGWDHPLLTFFAHVKRHGAEDDEDSFVEWIGGNFMGVYEVEGLVEAVRPYANVPYEMQVTLYGDKDEGR